MAQILGLLNYLCFLHVLEVTWGLGGFVSWEGQPCGLHTLYHVA